MTKKMTAGAETDRDGYPGLSSRSEILIAVTVAVIGTALSWVRMSGVARGTMWAEDGPVFSARSLNPSSQTAWIFTPYDGYTHALPQLISNMVWAVVPVADVAAAFSLAACAVAGTVAALVFVLTRSWRLHPIGRLILAATTVCVPDATLEVLGNLANVHWYLLWLSPFLFLFRPRSWGGAAVAAVGCFVILTTEIQSLLFTPLLLVHIRERKKIPLVVAAGAGAVVQLTTLLQGSRSRGDAPHWLAVVDGYFLHVPLTGLTGVGQASSALVAYSGWEVAYLSILPFLLCGAWFAWKSRRRAVLVLVFGAASAALWVAGFAINYRTFFDYPSFDFGELMSGVAQLRYAIVPTMLLFSFVGLAVGRALLQPQSRTAGIVVAVLCVAVFAAGFQVVDGAQRSAGPGWAVGIEEARAACDVSGVTSSNVPLAPAPWAVALPCERLEDASR